MHLYLLASHWSCEKLKVVKLFQIYFPSLRAASAAWLHIPNCLVVFLLWAHGWDFTPTIWNGGRWGKNKNKGSIWKLLEPWNVAANACVRWGFSDKTATGLLRVDCSSLLEQHVKQLRSFYWAGGDTGHRRPSAHDLFSPHSCFLWQHPA